MHTTWFSTGNFAVMAFFLFGVPVIVLGILLVFRIVDKRDEKRHRWVQQAESNEERRYRQVASTLDKERQFAQTRQALVREHMDTERWGRMLVEQPQARQLAEPQDDYEAPAWLLTGEVLDIDQ